MGSVTQELGRISQTLSRGISGLGTSRLAEERQRTRGAELDYRLGRNRIADERAEERWGYEQEGLKLGAQKAEAERLKGEQITTWGGETPDVFTAMMIAKAMPEFEKIYKGEAVVKDNVFQGLRLKDGSMLREVDRDKPKEAAALLSIYKVSSTYKDQIARIEEKEQILNEQGVPTTDPVYAKLEWNKGKAQAVLDSPEKMISVLRGQLKQLEKVGYYPDAVKRIKGEIGEQEVKIRERDKERRAVRLHEKQMANAELKRLQLEKEGKSTGGMTAYQKAQLIKGYVTEKRLSEEQGLRLIETLNEEYDREFSVAPGAYRQGTPPRKDWVEDKLRERAVLLGKKVPPKLFDANQYINMFSDPDMPREKFEAGMKSLREKVDTGNYDPTLYNKVLNDPKIQAKYSSFKQGGEKQNVLPPKKAKQLSDKIDDYIKGRGKEPTIPAMRKIMRELQIADEFIAGFLWGRPIKAIIEWLKRQPKDLTQPGKPIA